MTEIAQSGESLEEVDKKPEAGKNRRPYAPPLIISVEPLEVAAGLCDGSGFDGPGKSGTCLITPYGS